MGFLDNVKGRTVSTLSKNAGGFVGQRINAIGGGVTDAAKGVIGLGKGVFEGEYPEKELGVKGALMNIVGATRDALIAEGHGIFNFKDAHGFDYINPLYHMRKFVAGASDVIIESTAGPIGIISKRVSDATEQVLRGGTRFYSWALGDIGPYQRDTEITTVGAAGKAEAKTSEMVSKGLNKLIEGGGNAAG